MIKKILILSLFFYFLVLLQTSFLVHFKIFGGTPNFIFILVIIINLFDKPRSYFGLFSALVGGFLLDVFSSGFWGFYFLVLLSLSLFIKLVLKRYVWAPAG